MNSQKLHRYTVYSAGVIFSTSLIKKHKKQVEEKNYILFLKIFEYSNKITFPGIFTLNFYSFGAIVKECRSFPGKIKEQRYEKFTENVIFHTD